MADPGLFKGGEGGGGGRVILLMVCSPKYVSLLAGSALALE